MNTGTAPEYAGAVLPFVSAERKKRKTQGKTVMPGSGCNTITLKEVRYEQIQILFCGRNGRRRHPERLCRH